MFTRHGASWSSSSQDQPAACRGERIQALAFVLHELATNAVKHGALSKPEGRLRLTWTIEETAGNGCYLQLGWQEQGGPAIGPACVAGVWHEAHQAEAAELGVKLS